MNTDALAIARAFHRGWTRKNFDDAIGLLSADLVVEVPINDYPTPASFARALITFGSQVNQVEVLSETGTANEAMLLYDMDVNGLGALRVAEHFTVADGKIVRLRQIHDTALLRNSGFAQSTSHRSADGATSVTRIDDEGGYAAHLLIDAEPDTIFNALATLEGIAGWWASSVRGSGEPGGEMVLSFTGLDEEIRLRVDAAVRPSFVAWTCVSHSSLPEWSNTRIQFELHTSATGTTQVTFRHTGLVPSLVCFEDCESGWDHFLPSLAAYARTGKGTPFA